jgi:hypothetical protein
MCLAARARLGQSRPERIADVETLDRFLEECRAAELSTEPDWSRHLAVMEGSRRGDHEPA